MCTVYMYYTGTQNGVLITEDSSIQRSLQYYTRKQNSVPGVEVSSIQSFVIERSHCVHIHMCLCLFMQLVCLVKDAHLIEVIYLRTYLNTSGCDYVSLFRLTCFVSFFALYAEF